MLLLYAVVEWLLQNFHRKASYFSLPRPFSFTYSHNPLSFFLHHLHFCLFTVSFCFSFRLHFIKTLRTSVFFSFLVLVLLRVAFYGSWVKKQNKSALPTMMKKPNILCINYYCAILAICNKKRTLYYVYNTINELNML